jgi:hypothetical protein
MGHITKDHLERTKVVELLADEIELLAQVVEPIWDYQLQIGREIEKLFELRDFVLPKLISDEIQILDGELASK